MNTKRDFILLRLDKESREAVDKLKERHFTISGLVRDFLIRKAGEVSK